MRVDSSMGIKHYLLGFTVFLLLGSFCHGKKVTVQVVGLINCTDCMRNEFRSNQTSSGISVVISCKSNEKTTRGNGWVDGEGKFTVALSTEITELGNSIDVCVAKLHGASAALPCPIHSTQTASVKLLSSEKDAATQAEAAAAAAINQQIKFYPVTCQSAMFWPLPNFTFFHNSPPPEQPIDDSPLPPPSPIAAPVQPPLPAETSTPSPLPPRAPEIGSPSPQPDVEFQTPPPAPEPAFEIPQSPPFPAHNTPSLPPTIPPTRAPIPNPTPKSPTPSPPPFAQNPLPNPPPHHNRQFPPQRSPINQKPYHKQKQPTPVNNSPPLPPTASPIRQPDPIPTPERPNPIPPPFSKHPLPNSPPPQINQSPPPLPPIYNKPFPPQKPGHFQKQHLPTPSPIFTPKSPLNHVKPNPIPRAPPIPKLPLIPKVPRNYFNPPEAKAHPPNPSHHL